MEQTGTTDGDLDRAISAFEAGSPVLVHDSDEREAEVDLVYPAEAVAPETVARLRNDAGGLVCVALPDEVADAFGLPFLADVIDHPAAADHDLSYDDRSSFSLPVNHRETTTGVTDEDRARTITALAAAVDEALASDGTDVDERYFAARFRTPGHVHLLRAADGLLDERQGHTELGVALSNAAGRVPAVVVCEMLDDDTGEALSMPAARAYADRHGVPFLDGRQLVESLD